MIKKFLLLILALVVLSFNSAQAQNRKTYNLDAAINTALANNQEIKIAAMDIDKARFAVKEAFGYALPSVDVSASFSHYITKPKMAFIDFEALLNNYSYAVLLKEKLVDTNTYDNAMLPMGSKLQSFAQSNNYEAKAQVSQILFNSAVFEGIGSSQTYLQTSQKALRANIAKIVLNIKKAYNAVLLSKALLEITKSSLENGEQNLKNVKALLAQGMVSEYDALQAEVQVENIRPIVLQLENAHKNALNGLKLSMGISPNEDIDIEGELDYQSANTIKSTITPKLDDMISEAMVSNLDIITLENKKEIDRAMIALDKSEYWPQLNAFGAFSMAGSADNMSFNSYNSTMVGLSLSMNIFNGFRTDHKVQQSNIEVMKTEEQIAQLRNGIKLQLHSQLLELDRINRNIIAQEKNVALAQKGYELAGTRYKEGTGSQLEIQNADQALRQAKTNILQSVYEHIIATTEIETLIGKVEPKYFDLFKEKFENK